MDTDRADGRPAAEGGRPSGQAPWVRLPATGGWGGGPEDAAAAYWRAAGAWMPPGSRDFGTRQARRASNWTAAALVAGVAVTTGYLAHSTAATKSTATSASTHKRHGHHRAAVTGRTGQSGQTGQTGQAPAYVPPPPPPVQAPVVTSGGSGARGAAGGGGGGD